MARRQPVLAKHRYYVRPVHLGLTVLVLAGTQTTLSRTAA
jgi:hypothetical protein